jgi:hypothetical protein
MEEGFRTPAESSAIGLPSCISLVNGISSAEMARIQWFLKAEDGSAHLRTAAKSSKGKEYHMSEEMALTKGLV